MWKLKCLGNHPSLIAGKVRAGDPVAHSWLVNLGKNSGCWGPKSQIEAAEGTLVLALQDRALAV